MRARKHVSEHPITTMVEPFKTGFAVIGIDPGAKSGAAFGYDGKYRSSWQVSDNATERAAVVHHCVTMAQASQLPIVVVMEKWGAYGDFWTGVGLGRSSGRWMEQLELHGIPKSRLHRVLPSTWRKPFGLGSVKGKDAKKAAAVQLAAVRLGIDSPGEDQAEAALMVEWALKDPAVWERVPTRKVKI